MTERDWADKIAHYIVSELYKDQHDPTRELGLVPVWTRSGPYGMLFSAIAGSLRKAKSAGIQEITPTLNEARKIEWPSKETTRDAYRLAFLKFPSQDNDAYLSDRGGFEAGWFACLHWLKSYMGDKAK